MTKAEKFFQYGEEYYHAKFKVNDSRTATSFQVFQVESWDCEEHTFKYESEWPFVSGAVKWDGCSNFSFDSQEECMPHRCSRQGMYGIGELLDAVWRQCLFVLKTEGAFVDEYEGSIEEPESHEMPWEE